VAGWQRQLWELGRKRQPWVARRETDMTGQKGDCYDRPKDSNNYDWPNESYSYEWPEEEQVRVKKGRQLWATGRRYNSYKWPEERQEWVAGRKWHCYEWPSFLCLQ
jgi:hypothetical protein